MLPLITILSIVTATSYIFVSLVAFDDGRIDCVRTFQGVGGYENTAPILVRWAYHQGYRRKQDSIFRNLSTHQPGYARTTQ